MLRDLLDHVGGPWRAQLRQAGVAPRPPLAAVKLSQRTGRWDEATYLVFGADAREPALVLQTAGRTADQRRLAGAHRAHTDLWEIPALQGTVPRPAGLFEIDDVCVLATVPLAGTPLDVLVRRRERARLDQIQYDLFRAQVWLQLLQEATAYGVADFEGRAAVEERLALVHHAGLPIDPALRAFAARLADLAADHKGLALPLTGRHGEFQPDNVLFDTTRLGVIGWGHFEEGVTPFADLFRFALGLARDYFASGHPPEPPDAAFRHAFLDRNRFSALILEYVDRYLRAMHLPPEAAHLFFGLFLLDMVLDERQAGHAARKQSSVWLPLLVLYARHDTDSIFFRASGLAPGGTPSTSPVRRVA